SAQRGLGVGQGGATCGHRLLGEAQRLVGLALARAEPRQRDGRQRARGVGGRRRLRGLVRLRHAAGLLHEREPPPRLALGRARELVRGRLVGVHGAIELVRGFQQPTQPQGDVAGRGGQGGRLLEQLLRARRVARGGLGLRLLHEVLGGDGGRLLRPLLLVLVFVLVRGGRAGQRQGQEPDEVGHGDLRGRGGRRGGRVRGGGNGRGGWVGFSSAPFL